MGSMIIKEKFGPPRGRPPRKALVIIESEGPRFGGRSGVYTIDGHFGNKQYLRGVILSSSL